MLNLTQVNAKCGRYNLCKLCCDNIDSIDRKTYKQYDCLSVLFTD